MPNDREIGEINARMTGLEKEVTKLGHHLYGNGREGILQVTSRMEENIEEIGNDVKQVSDDIGEIRVLVGENSRLIHELAIHVNKLGTNGCPVGSANAENISRLIAFQREHDERKEQMELEEATAREQIANFFNANFKWIVIIILVIILLLTTADATVLSRLVDLINITH